MNDKKYNFVLWKLADIPIERYVKVKKDSNPFDQTWNADSKEDKENAVFAPQKRRLYRKGPERCHETDLFYKKMNTELSELYAVKFVCKYFDKESG